MMEEIQNSDTIYNRLLFWNLAFYRKVRVLICVILVIGFISGSRLYAQSTQLQTSGNDSLIVYTDVPGLAPSEFYKIRVRLAGTSEWHESFAHITRSQYALFVDSPIKPGENYFEHLSYWSHSYSNIEMNAPVEIELEKVNGDPVNRAVVHPRAKGVETTITDGKVYFTIEKPGQFTIDIDGQMDDQDTGRDYAGPPIHTVSVYANPIMDKPDKDAPGVVVVSPGTDPPTDPNTFETLYFDAGIHDIGRSYKVHANKKYYIAGDAIVYGTFTNIVEDNGQNIKIYGVGTISGAKIKHPTYDPDSPTYGESANPVDGIPWKPIGISYADNTSVEGVTLDDPAFHSIQLTASDNSIKSTSVKWVKIVTWRANGDGIGNAHLTEDCFIRTQDDCSYVKGDKRRCVFWTDANGAVFVHAVAAERYRIVIEDCDVIYARSQGKTWEGGRIFSWRAMDSPPGQVKLNLLFRDIRIEDPRPTLQIFNMYSIADFDLLTGDARDGRIVSSFSGITWQNVVAAGSSILGLPEVLRGCEASPFSDLVFDNVRIGGKKLTGLDDFAYVQYVEAAFNPEITHDATLFDLRLDGNTISGFDPDTFVYNIFLPAGTKTAPKVSATTSDNNAVITAVKNPESLPGIATVEITAEDGFTRKIYVISFNLSKEPGQASGNNWDIEDTTPMYEEDGIKKITGFEFKENEIPTVFDAENSGLAPGEGVEGSQALKSTVSGSTGASAGVTLWTDYVDISDFSSGEYVFSFWAKSSITPPTKPFWILAKTYDADKNEVTLQTLEKVDNGGTSSYLGMAAQYTSHTCTNIIKPNTSGGNNAAYMRFQIQHGKYDNSYWFDEFALAAPVKTNTGLTGITINGTPLSSFTTDVKLYTIELPNGTLDIPVVSAETSDATATIEIIDAASLPGVTGIQITYDDGTIELYSVIFTLAEDILTGLNAPVELIQGEPATVYVDYKISEARDIIVELQSDNPLTIYGTTTVNIPKGEGTVDVSFPVDISVPAGADAYSIVAYLTVSGGTSQDSFDSIRHSGIDVLPPPSSVATLSDLRVDGNTVSDFSESTEVYDVELPEGTTAVPVVTATATDGNADVLVTNATGLPGSATVFVTAEDGITTKTYTINFTVAPSSDATLADLSVNGTTVTDFSASKEVYDIELSHGTADVPEVTATATNENADVQIIDAASLPGSTTVLVTAEDNVSARTYTINFTIAPSNVNISKLNQPDPDFANVYPNPAQDFLNIDFATTGRRKIDLFNSYGQIIYNAQTSDPKIVIDMTALHVRGVVIVQIRTDNAVTNYKVIINQ